MVLEKDNNHFQRLLGIFLLVIYKVKEKDMLLKHGRIALTAGLARFGCWINLVTLFTFTFVAAHLVDADLTAGFRVGTLINI